MRTAEEIRSYILERRWGTGMAQLVVKLTDEVYSTPTREFLLGPALAAFGRNLEVMGFGPWVANRNDCDKFTRRFTQFVRDSHAITAERQGEKGTGIAVGDFAYVSQAVFPPAGHMIAIALVEGAAGLTHVFLETVPENGLQEVELSEEELASASFIYL